MAVTMRIDIFGGKAIIRQSCDGVQAQPEEEMDETHKEDIISR